METKIIEFCRKNYNIDFSSKNNNLRDVSFFNPAIAINPFELLYLFRYITDELQCEVSEDAIISGAFYSFNTLIKSFDE